MPTDLLTTSGVRTKTGTEIHRAFSGSCRTDCGCRVYSRLTPADLFKAQAAGVLCLKCWGPAGRELAPADWQARLLELDASREVSA